MSNNLRQALLFLPIAALLIALGYWNIRPESFGEAQIGDSPEASIDFFVVNPHTRQFKADGSLNYRVEADKLEHVKATDITLMSQPDLLLYRKDEQPWHVQSQLGEVAPGGKQVELIDAVSVQRTDLQGRQTLLTTSRMTVFPDQEYAETKQAVKIEAANGVTTANGMKAYLNEGRMLLLSNVRGQHELR
ncbi:LPS export ABC transporter periplasmic protein LptC [Pseudomonas sp. N040]|uniref:LPS export ABC transporter periplasmic protein LptC n=1 Tax=Pseudomonas sp. N040 TaxID=2785325 RepID=UPI0018A27A65|nr:LPS export ABC transporter periplasmic protein LptC [Pseudomonas sp. N040]MBF7730306.1 LPS export ABC transporter periplasmic protein LptC [Pseudomonas sp. N040]MBW7013948.1 LPS export ABC transporter periplasmic protein LptC [Pseudomonas sp. N040]